MKVETRAAAGGCDGSISRIRHPRLGRRPRTRGSPCRRYGGQPCPAPLAPSETIAASPKRLGFEQRYIETRPARRETAVAKPKRSFSPACSSCREARHLGTLCVSARITPTRWIHAFL